MSEFQTVENKQFIADRVPPGDRWTLTASSEGTVYDTLTDTLEAYLGATSFKGEYRLDPLGSKLYAIKTSEEEIKPEPIKRYNIYGDEY